MLSLSLKRIITSFSAALIVVSAFFVAPVLLGGGAGVAYALPGIIPGSATDTAFGNVLGQEKQPVADTQNQSTGVGQAAVPGIIPGSAASNAFRNAIPGLNQDGSINGGTPAQAATESEPGKAKSIDGEPYKDESCGFTDIVGCVVNLSHSLLVEVPGWIMSMAGLVFDTLIALSLSSTIINQQGFVDKGWVVMRDLSNTFFIFILLYIAISTILQTAAGGTKKLLAQLIMVALLMNFSLYITKFVIDVGNVLALEFYDSISANDLPYFKLPANDITPKSISNGFVNAFALQSLNGPALLQKDRSTKIFTYFMTGIMLLVATFVFLTAGFLFLARVVAFWLLMIVSPFAFFSLLLPKGNIFHQWFSQLVSQSFFAPIFLFFVYLTLVLANTLHDAPLFMAGTPFTQNEATGMTDLILIFLKFFAIIFVLLSGLKIAKGMSGAAGTAMLGVANRVKGYAGVVAGAGLGVAAYAGRNLIGRQALALKKEKEGEWEKSRFGRAKLALTNTIASGSFDARAAGAGKLAGMAGVSLGAAGGKGGFAGAVEPKGKDIADHTKELLAKDPEAAAHYLATHEMLGDRDTTAAMASLTYAQRAELIAKAKPGKEQERLKAISEKLGAGLTPKQQKAEAKEMAPEHIKTIEKLGTAAEKATHYNSLNAQHKLEIYKSMTAAQRTMLTTHDKNIFDTEHALLTDEEKERITESGQKSKKIQEEKEAKEKLEQKKVSLAATTDQMNATLILNGMKAEDVAKLDPSILLRPHIIKSLNGKALVKIAAEGKLNNGQFQTLINNALSDLPNMSTTALSAMSTHPAFLDSITPQQKLLINTELGSR